MKQLQGDINGFPSGESNMVQVDSMIILLLASDGPTSQAAEPNKFIRVKVKVGMRTELAYFTDAAK